MPVNELDRLLEEAAAEVLETMFFTGLSDEEEAVQPRLAEPLVCTRVVFRGAPSGRLGIRVSADTGRQIAANFLGLDASEVCDARMEEVLCELSNMVCGSVLSRIEKDFVFELQHPEIEPAEAGGPRGDQAIRRTLILEEGVMEVWFELEAPQ